MKTIKVFLGLAIMLLFFSCSNKWKGFDKLIGEWGYSGDSTVQFTKQDTVVLGILIRPIFNYSGDRSTEYEVGSVLFKDIRKLTELTFLAKGLYISSVYRTEQVLTYGWTGNHWGNYYVDKQVFDHIEKTYVDYRLEIIENYKPLSGVSCCLLKCTPFADGPKWEFIGNLSSDGKRVIYQEQKRIADSIRIADSLAMDQAESLRIQAEESKKAKKAAEFLK